MPVTSLPPPVPTPSEAAEGVVQMRGCARAAVHARSCTREEGLALLLPRQQLSGMPVTTLPFAAVLLLLLLGYT